MPKWSSTRKSPKGPNFPSIFSDISTQKENEGGGGQPKPGKTEFKPRVRSPHVIRHLYSHVEAIFLQHSKEMSFSSFARAIERGDAKTIDRTLELPPIRVDFRDLMKGTSILHVAAKGSQEMLEKLLKYPHIQGMIDAADYTGATPLMVAVLNESLPAVRCLLENGAKTKYYMHETGQTVLHVAAGLKNEAILREILKYNDSPHFLDWHDKEGDTALLKSVENDSCAEILLKSGASHNALNKMTKRNILHLSVLYHRRNLLKALIKLYPEIPFIAALDANGDSPLTLAYRLKDPVSAKILLRSAAGSQLVKDFPGVLIKTIKIGDERLFDDVLNHSRIEDVTKYCNEDGDNALMVATASQHVQMVKKLLAAGVQVISQKNSNGQTILDKIENIRNATMAKIILNAIFTEIQSSEIDLKSTYETILRRGSLGNFIVFHQPGLFEDLTFDKGESALYIAAKRGNYGACLFLLLSKNCSKLNWVGDTLDLPTEKYLLRYFLKRELFASDFYILTGKIPPNPQWNYSPKQGHLFENTDEDRNIFHACSLGGSLETLVFIYKYCQEFMPKECQQLDAPDATGTTPLLLAILNKKSDLGPFFIQKGANLIKRNFANQNPIKALRKHILSHKTLLTQAMTQSIVDDQAPSHKGPKTQFSVYFYIFRPTGTETSEVGNALASLPFYEYQEILCHPLFEYFVWSLWKIVGPTMVLRFYIDVAAVLVFSAYLTVRYSEISHMILVDKILWYAAMWLAEVNFFFHLPTCGVGSTMERKFLLKSKVAVPMAVIVYLALFDGDDRNSLEFGGATILMSWLALLFHGVACPLGEQIASFCIVFQELLRVTPTFFIVTFSFTMLLFTLFHGHIMYNNPLQAFLFAAYQIPAGAVDKVPTLYQHLSDDPVKGQAIANWSSTEVPANTSLVHENPLEFLMGNEIRTMLVEGTAIIFYLLLATALSNMLTALAIRKGQQHLRAKKAKNLSHKMTRIHEWEKFSDGKLHAFLHKCKALWVVGVHPNIKESFNIPLAAHPTKTRDGFDIFKMKNFLTQKENLISNTELDFLLPLLAIENIPPTYQKY